MTTFSTALSMTRLLACLMLSVLTAGCTSGGEDADLASPTIVIGIDGLEWSVVTQMLDAGRLPNLAELMERGRYGSLRVTKPTLSPIIWTSIATGVGPAKHGIGGFVHPAREGEPLQLYTSADRRVKALWNIASDAARRTYVVGWWMTYPVEPIEGIMVAQVNTITPEIRRAGKGVWKGRLVPELEGQVHPRELEADLLSIVPEAEADLDPLVERIFGPLPSGLDQVARRYLEQSRWAFRADALYHRIGLSLLREQPAPALFAIYFGGADVVGHRFWRYLEPSAYAHPPAERDVAALSEIIPKYYAYLDSIVGDIVAAAGSDATVIVLSDHGMGPANRRSAYRRDTLSGGHLHAPPAFFVASGPRIAAPDTIVPAGSANGIASLGTIFDVAPTVLAILGVPVGRDMEGDVMTDVVARSWLERHPVRYVDTHTDDAWQTRRERSSGRADGLAERLDQLRALGYID